MAAKLLVLALLINASLGFLFSRSRPQANADGREVEQSCLDHADNGNCEFYSCFERRLPCGRNWYMLKHGHYYCNKMVARKPNFTPEGQVFLENVQECLTESVQQYYSRDTMDCHDLEHYAVAAISPCFTQHGFCDVLRTDAEEFFHVYEVRDLFTRGSAKLWHSMLNISTHCGLQYARRFTNQASEGILGAINDAFSNVASSISNYMNNNN